MSDRQNGQSAFSLLVLEPIRARGGGRALGAQGRYFPPSFGPGRGSREATEGKKIVARARLSPRWPPPPVPGRAHLPALHPGRGQRGCLVSGARGPRSGGGRRGVGASGLRGDSRVPRPAARLLRRRQPRSRRRQPLVPARSLTLPPGRGPHPRHVTDRHLGAGQAEPAVKPRAAIIDSGSVLRARAAVAAAIFDKGTGFPRPPW